MQEKRTVVIDFIEDEKLAVSLEDIYKSAEIVYGNVPKKNSVDKFRHILNDEFIHDTMNEYVRYANKSLTDNYKKRKTECLKFMDYFIPMIDNLLFPVFCIRKIQEIHPDSEIIFITSDKRFLHIYKIVNLLDLNRLKVIFVSSASSAKDKLIEFLASGNKIFFIFLNLLYVINNYAKIIFYKIRKKTIPPPEIDIVLLSAIFGNWSKNSRGEYFDFYYQTTCERLSKHPEIRSKCIVNDINNIDADNSSYFDYLTLSEVLINLVSSFWEFLSALPSLKKSWILVEKDLLTKIVHRNSVEILMRKFKPKAVVYYSEVFSFGRAIACVLKKLGIAAYGYEHCVVSKFHLTYKTLSLYKDMPEILPDYFFIYGPYIVEMFSSYGYPEERMIEMGCDRFDIDFKEKEISQQSEKKTVLFIGQLNWMNKFFETLYTQKEKYPIGRILFRPHPRYKPNVEEFLKRFPGVEYNDPVNNDLNEVLDGVDCVIGGFSTSLLHAIAKERVTIVWLPYNMADLSDLGHWGAQVVHNLDEIDWNKKSDSHKLKKEIISDIDIADMLAKKYSANVNKNNRNCKLNGDKNAEL